MGLRLYSEFHSSNGALYKVEIYDSDFTSASDSFTVAGDGFTLNYDGETDDIVSPIIGSNCTVSAYNNKSTFDSFINNLQDYQEDRFTLRILKDTGSGYFTYWTGIIVQDLVTVEDTHKPYVFQITAVDGIGHLANKDYTWNTYDTIESFLERAVGAIGLGDLYSATDSFYATTLNTWDTNHTYNAGTDVSTLIRFHAPILRSRESDGSVVYPKYLEVLKELCIAFGARFYQQNGIFHFEQYLEREPANRTVHTYQYNGVSAGVSTESGDITLDGTTSGGARLANNSFNFLPALKKVEVRHNRTIRENLLGRFVNFYTTTTALSLGVLSDDNNAYLQLNGKLNYRLTHPTTGSNTGYFRARFRIEIKIEDQDNLGTYYYLKRDWNPSGGQLYGATTWTTTASYYYLDATLAQNSATGLTVSNLFTVVTPSLPVEGEATIDIEQNGLFDQTNASVSVPSGYFAGWSVEDVLVTYKSDEANSVSTKYFSSNGSANINSNLVLDLGEVRLADAFGGPGSFLVYDGSAWVPSSDWRRGNSGGYENLLSLLTKEVLSLHAKPIERYSGTIVGANPFGVRYVFESSYWLPTSGSFNANTDEWSAEWFKIEKNAGDVTIGSPVDEGGLGDFSGRVSSSQGTDEFINGVQVTTTTSKVTGNATVGGTLGVTGASTLGTTSVGEFTTTDRVNVTINEITGNPGGSETISLRDHFNFITYSGGNGNYTINLPASENGVILRFKTNDRVVANKTITLQPQSGERIDAEDSYIMDRSYDGITLLGNDQNWFIIQKKEK